MSRLRRYGHLRSGWQPFSVIISQAALDNDNTRISRIFVDID
ncbi:unnamed protein product [Rhodiola kirilowii]